YLSLPRLSDTRSTRWLIGVAFVPVRSHRGTGRHQLRETTIIDSLRRNWIEEDRRTHAKWMRVIAVFYGCVALCVSGLVVLTRPSALRRMRPEIVRAGPPACSASGWTTTSTLRGKRDESCMFRRAGSPHGYQPKTGDCPDGRQACDSTPAPVVRPTLPGSDGTSRLLHETAELAAWDCNLCQGRPLHRIDGRSGGCGEDQRALGGWPRP